MKRHINFVKSHKRLSLILLGIVIVLGFLFWPKPPAALEVQNVKKGNITETLSTSGNIISQTSVDLSFTSPGKLTFLNAKKGEEVKAGQVIATLDQRSVQKNMQASLRDYSKQRNNFEQTKDDKGTQKIENAPDDRIKRILENNQYDLEKSVISVELQSLAREQSVLTTPISGIVTRADVSSPGVNVGLTTTFTVADPTNLIFRIEVDEADIGKVRLNQEMNVVLDAYPNQTLNVTVHSIDFATHKTETGGNAFYVEAQLPENTDMTYRIGMTGNGEVVVNEAKDILIIPLASIQDEKYVFVQTEKGFEKREVKLGIESDTEIEAKAGLKEGEKVALDPAAAEERTKNKKQFGIF